MIKHFYSFNREKYLQKSDGPIGLRSTCEVARITMNMWNVKWMDCKKVEEHYPEGGQFMNDGNPGSCLFHH